MVEMRGSEPEKEGTRENSNIGSFNERLRDDLLNGGVARHRTGGADAL